MTTPSSAAPAEPATGERADLLAMLARTRHFLRFTTRDLTDDQARQATTASVLCLGGLIKHVAAVENNWMNFATGNDSSVGGDSSEENWSAYADGFKLLPGETLAGVLEDYAEVARRTDELAATLDLDESRPLPPAPWFAPGERWSARRVFLHVIAETAQHAGHADIIRETLDGAKTMG